MATHPVEWFAALRGYLSATAFLDILWEAAHLPLYTIWTDGTIRENGFAVLHCTMGDVLIALAALAAALVVTGDQAWPARRWTPVAALTLAIGVGYTVYSEHINVDVQRSWTYSDLMPRLPLLGTGLSPIVQWVIVPAAALVWARRRAFDTDGGKRADDT
jgi:hypothetical protein